MKYLLIFILSILPALAMAQEEDVDPLTECAAVLAAPPFVDILTRNEGRDFQEFSPRKSGRALLGLECRVDEVTAFFETSGWEFLEFEEGTLSGPFGGQYGIPRYYRDSGASYCLKRPVFLGLFRRCRAMSGILFHNGRISHLIVNVSK